MFYTKEASYQGSLLLFYDYHNVNKSNTNVFENSCRYSHRAVHYNLSKIRNREDIQLAHKVYVQ